MKRFFGTTRTADDDCAETQYATENALSNPYAFDLAKQSLQRAAANQARRSITAMSPVTSTPTIKMTARNFAMSPPTK